MKSWIYSVLLIVLFSCRSSDDQAEVQQQAEQTRSDSTEDIKFFPVTDFILGQLAEIRMQGINPMKISGRDTSWIRVENLESEVADFLQPVIDTSNMKEFFSESRFLDQSINAYTFVYEPRGKVPDSISLQSWMVYVNPEKNKVKTIILQKNEKGLKGILTWEAGKNCRMLYLKESPSGEAMVEKETFINWDY